MCEYGRYVDPVDGLPRWNVPPRKGHSRERYAMIREAIGEFYATRGAVWLSERMNRASSWTCVRQIARKMGIRKDADGLSFVAKRRGRKLRAMRKTNKVRADYGLPRLTRYHLATMSRRKIQMRYFLMKSRDYMYGDPPDEMYYDGLTRRRDDEERLSKEYGLVFLKAEE